MVRAAFWLSQIDPAPGGQEAREDRGMIGKGMKCEAVGKFGGARLLTSLDANS
jgi:hypothetical protein